MPSTHVLIAIAGAFIFGIVALGALATYIGGVFLEKRAANKGSFNEFGPILKKVSIGIMGACAIFELLAIFGPNY